MSMAVICIGVLVLYGWLFNITLFKSILPNYIAMNSNSAVTFVLIGISLLLQRRSLLKKHYFFSAIGKLIGVVLAIFGLMALIELIFKINFQLDQFIIMKNITTISAPIVTLNFFLIGLSLILLNIKNTLYLN